MTRRTVIIALTVLALMVLTVSPAFADTPHPHRIETPNGKCHQVAQGQTDAKAGDGGYHRFHDNVHSVSGGDMGRSERVFVFKGLC